MRDNRSQRARELRKQPTKAERMLWNLLRDRRLGKWKFRRQHPIGPYFADFFCESHKLAVEVDGVSHADKVEHDERRDIYFRGAGIAVLRVGDEDVRNNIEGVWVEIRNALAERESR